MYAYVSNIHTFLCVFPGTWHMYVFRSIYIHTYIHTHTHTYIHIHTYICVCVCMCVYLYKKQRLMSGVFFNCLLFYVLKQSLLAEPRLCWFLLIQLLSLLQEGLFVSHFWVLGLELGHRIQPAFMGARDWKRSLHACMESTLPVISHLPNSKICLKEPHKCYCS
jgi:hypothetical protein